MLPKLAAGFPGLYMRTEINTSQDLVRALLGGRLDIAVILDPPKISDLNAVKIGNIELVLCTNKAASQLHNIPEIGHIFVDWGTAFNLQHFTILLLLFCTPHKVTLRWNFCYRMAAQPFYPNP